MRGQRGKKPKYVVYSNKGLLEDRKWLHFLKNRPTELVCKIRRELAKNISGLNEKFNCNSRYFGYWVGDDKDRLYIYVQRKYLRIDLCIAKKYKKDIRKTCFEVVFVNNFQYRVKWLTGWRVPHTIQNIETVLKWLRRAFIRTNLNKSFAAPGVWPIK